jgi:hypothetical protein
VEERKEAEVEVREKGGSEVGHASGVSGGVGKRCVETPGGVLTVCRVLIAACSSGGKRWLVYGMKALGACSGKIVNRGNAYTSVFVSVPDGVGRRDIRFI